MKRLALAMGLVAAAAFAAPLAAQSRNDGPWYDPANTGTRSGSTARVDNRNGVYNDGRISDSRTADGRWHRVNDRNGNAYYVRTRYDSNGNLIQERATRNFLGQYRVVDRRVIQYARNSNDRYDRNGRNDRDGRYDDRRDRNDRWDQNNGHDNGKHNGQYKNKGKNKGRR
jgi:hypothetical protein